MTDSTSGREQARAEVAGAFEENASAIVESRGRAPLKSRGGKARLLKTESGKIVTHGQLVAGLLQKQAIEAEVVDGKRPEWISCEVCKVPVKVRSRLGPVSMRCSAHKLYDQCKAGCGAKVARFRKSQPSSGMCGKCSKGAKTPEQLSAAAKKAAASRTPEQRSESARKGIATTTPQQRSDAARKAHAARTPEQWSKMSKKTWASKTPEQRSEIVRKTQASRTPEQRSESARKTWIARRTKAPSDWTTVKLDYDSAAIGVDRDELRAAIAEAEKRAADRAAKKAAKA